MKKITIVKFKPAIERDRQIKSSPKKSELPWHHSVPVLQRLYTR
jgi:hypothetical protein